MNQTTEVRLPAYGRETAQWVLEAIKASPELHDQGTWEEVTDCGTAMCVAGWVAFVHKDLFDKEVARYSWGHIDARPSWAFRFAGAKGLRIDEGDAEMLFYRTNNQEAVRALEFLAAGQEIDWSAVYVDSVANAQS